MSDWFEDQKAEMDTAAKEEKEQHDAASWEPEVGDTLEGVFVKATVVKTKRYGPAYEVYVRTRGNTKKFDGPIVRVFVLRSVLRSQLTDAFPARGKLIVIQYYGLVESENGRDYHSYQLRAEEQDLEYWTPLIRKWNELDAQHQAAKAAGPAALASSDVGAEDDPFS